MLDTTITLKERISHYFCLRFAKTSFIFLLQTSSTLLTPCHSNLQVRSQKFAMWGLFWGSEGGAPSRRRQMETEAGGFGAKPPAAEGTGQGAEPLALENFAFFC